MIQTELYNRGIIFEREHKKQKVEGIIARHLQLLKKGCVRERESSKKLYILCIIAHLNIGIDFLLTF